LQSTEVALSVERLTHVSKFSSLNLAAADTGRILKKEKRLLELSVVISGRVGRKFDL
jgi:hypothetical protein